MTWWASIPIWSVHSVEAADGKQSCVTHGYLAKLTTIERSLFDWESGAASPYTDENYDLMKREFS
ncbi:MAG: hypothetical protein GY935_11035 [Gammaproteobacteria bacterium]|nr:hypothetical protein [Gammaproteobacteria bacterium]